MVCTTGAPMQTPLSMNTPAARMACLIVATFIGNSTASHAQTVQVRKSQAEDCSVIVARVARGDETPVGLRAFTVGPDLRKGG